MKLKVSFFSCAWLRSRFSPVSKDGKIRSILILPTFLMVGPALAENSNLPSTDDTVSYIENNTVGSIRFIGGLQLFYSGNIWWRQIDLMNAGSVYSSGNHVFINCDSAYDKCVQNANITTFEDGPTIGADDPSNDMRIQVSNDATAPRVARAIRHLIQLVRQQNASPNDPFAK